jgi:hypothetical protein
MATLVQINTPGMASTDPGYISSITIRSNAADNVLTPNASTGQVTLPGTDSNAAATKLCVDYSRFRIVTGF